MRALILLIAALFCIGRAAAAAPEVVVSIKPIHSLVAAVMEGVATPALIVAGGASPHLYALRPSDAEHLASARIIFWIGPIFESFLAKPLAALAGRAEIVELDRAPEITLLPAREGGLWERHADEPAHHRANERDAADADMDGHLWLDPANAKAIAAVTATRLAIIDPANAARYRENAAALSGRLEAFDAALDERLRPLRERPFVVFHDAYQYLTRRYGLAAVGSVTVSPERAPSARRIAAIHAKVAALKARCVFREPQFPPRLVDTVMAGTTARSGVLDPEGSDLAPGPNLYFTLMSKLADALTNCLAP
ncbi:MAG TPA: zinc ABC transporter substrate-binding protein [Stellaceae bacterium]|nr:zinc ABC transporter substrate-binding protein [Stellaceae bacterium]